MKRTTSCEADGASSVAAPNYEQRERGRRGDKKVDVRWQRLVELVIEYGLASFDFERPPGCVAYFGGPDSASDVGD